MKTKNIQIKDITIRDDLLEIRPINKVTVSEYRQAMRRGDVFPRIIITPESDLVCGHQRLYAMTDEYGDDHQVEAEVRKYATEADLIADAVRDNVRHGLRMSSFNKKVAISKLAALDYPVDKISEVLGVSVNHVKELAGLTVVVRGRTRKEDEAKPYKRGLEPMNGTSVTKKQYAEHVRKDRGMPVVACANQLTRWLRNGWVDSNDSKAVSAMEQLHAALTEWMG